jgi:hypothetical protein
MAMYIFYLIAIHHTRVVIEEVYKFQTGYLIEELDTYYKNNNHYPDILANAQINSPLLPVEYYCSPDNAWYSISFSHTFLITATYTSKNRKWRNYGWND